MKSQTNNQNLLEIYNKLQQVSSTDKSDKKTTRLKNDIKAILDPATVINQAVLLLESLHLKSKTRIFLSLDFIIEVFLDDECDLKTLVHDAFGIPKNEILFVKFGSEFCLLDDFDLVLKPNDVLFISRVARSKKGKKDLNKDVILDMKNQVKRLKLELVLAHEIVQKSIQVMATFKKEKESTPKCNPNDVPTDRNKMNIMISDIKQDRSEIWTRYDALKEVVTDMQRDITILKSRPSATKIENITKEMNMIEDELSRYKLNIDNGRTFFKNIWTRELKQIVTEQSEIKDHEVELDDILDGTYHMKNVLETIKKVLVIKPAVKPLQFKLESVPVEDLKSNIVYELQVIGISSQEKSLERLKAIEKNRERGKYEVKEFASEFHKELFTKVPRR